ncbi:hypothetical protein TSOC_003359 [Tetrabaena socialis]|uniref:Uncharacterized protein n=1 Tax=Tetrabaena socialis TaxID=47790 RepID=A0A2J8ABS5_9CHLO|nr:hypothetical protein TSOC_003359 [Tetrabaena socialis]|eukprot:PNH09970.1 hypothetical protein TSOC_003359 [Tetrabaena socialis]
MPLPAYADEVASRAAHMPAAGLVAALEGLAEYGFGAALQQRQQHQPSSQQQQQQPKATEAWAASITEALLQPEYAPSVEAGQPRPTGGRGRPAPAPGRAASRSPAPPPPHPGAGPPRAALLDPGAAARLPGLLLRLGCPPSRAWLGAFLRCTTPTLPRALGGADLLLLLGDLAALQAGPPLARAGWWRELMDVWRPRQPGMEEGEGEGGEARWTQCTGVPSSGVVAAAAGADGVAAAAEVVVEEEVAAAAAVLQGVRWRPDAAADATAAAASDAPAASGCGVNGPCRLSPLG